MLDEDTPYFGAPERRQHAHTECTGFVRITWDSGREEIVAAPSFGAAAALTRATIIRRFAWVPVGEAMAWSGSDCRRSTSPTTRTAEPAAAVPCPPGNRADA